MTDEQDANIKYDQKGYRVAGLYPYAPNVDIIHCPADARFKLQAPNFAYRSYSGCGGVNDFQKTTSIKHPADRYLWVEENDPRGMTVNGKRLGENLGSWVFDGDPTPPDFLDVTWYDAPAAFHIASGTFSFVDGHVESHRWLDNATLALCYYQAGWNAGGPGAPSESRRLAAKSP